MNIYPGRLFLCFFIINRNYLTKYLEIVRVSKDILKFYQILKLSNLGLMVNVIHEGVSNMDKLKLIIPVYLNQRIVFDLMAMLQDGIATVTKISENETSKGIDERRYGAAFGLNKAFSALLKIDVSGEAKKADEDSTHKEKSEERIHTPASLLYKLRNRLIEKKSLSIADSSFKPETGLLVEFKTVLYRNPLIQTMDAFIKVMNLAKIFTADNVSKGKGKGKPSNAIPQKDPERILNAMEEFRRELKSGETVDIVSDNLEFGYQAVITLENEFLNDPSMSDLVDGTFQVIGKIIRVIPTNDEKISLIRKTAFSALPLELLHKTFTPLSIFARNQGPGIPELKWEIEGPLIHVVPLAIFT